MLAKNSQVCRSIMTKRFLLSFVLAAADLLGPFFKMHYSFTGKCNQKAYQEFVFDSKFSRIMKHERVSHENLGRLIIDF